MSTNCSEEKTLYSDVRSCQGKKSLPGLRRTIYLASIRDIVTYPTMPNRNGEEMSLEKIPVYTGNFALAQGKKFIRVDIIINDGQLQVEAQGTIGSRTFHVTATVNAPGTEEEITGLISEVLNDEIIALVQQRNGKFRVVGSEAFPATVNPQQATGQSATDTNQTTLEIVADDEYPAPFYEGTIPVTEGELNCKTGVVTTAQASANPGES